MDELINDDLETAWEESLLFKSQISENDFYSEAGDKIDEKDLPKSEHLNILSRCFGHKSFRPMQWKIINSVMNERRDNCAIMTTGYGKSLCYQYPSAYMGGITIVVSPLISLMEDQVLAMKVANMSACLLGSANSNQKNTIDEIFKNKYNLVYLTPEFCTGSCGRDLLKNMYEKLSITLVAIDEAHCASTWGHDFRFQYRELGVFKEIMPDIPILAVTATATSKVRDDFIKLLKLKNPLISCTGFDRPNLFFSVHPKDKNPLVDFRKVMERQGGQWKFSGSTIIYCITRKNTEELSVILSGAGIESLPYHAGLPLKVRKETHEKFVKDKLDVIVATIAFGMGIDKPDVRNIIHYGASSSIEGYYQEVGRAGRDGLAAKCTAFYANNDFTIHRRLREQSSGSAANTAHKEKMADLMLEYLSSRDCRRQFILSYFGDDKAKVRKNPLCCDNCVRKRVQPDNEIFKDLDDQGKYDFTQDAKMFLEAVNELQGRFGINMYVLFIRGSKASKLIYYVKNPLHGCGKDRSEIWWKGIGALLEKEKYLEKKANASSTGFKYYTSHITPKGKQFLQNIERNKLISTPTPDLISCLKTKTNAWLGSRTVNHEQAGLGSQAVNIKPEQPSTSSLVKLIKNKDKESSIKLYKLLMNKRYEIATSLDCMPYSIAANKVLMDMAIEKPTTLEEMKKCKFEGLSEVKIVKFGPEFLKIIRSSLNLDTDVEQKKLSIEEILTKYPLANVGASPHVSYTHFKAGLTVEEIAQKRGVLPNTIFNHLADCIKLGYPIKLVELGVTDEIKETIINVIKTVDTGLCLLTPIKNACPEDITYNQVKIVVNYLLVRQHLKSLNLEYEDFDDVHGIESIPTEPSTAREDSSQANPHRNLTQLLDAIDEVNKTPTDINSEKEVSNVDEDSNFSEGFADADLAAACDILETSLKENNDGEPLPKKLKTEDSFLSSVLNSPSRESNSTKHYSISNDQSVAIISKPTEEQPMSKQADQINNRPVSSSSKTNKNKLPPWLMMKRIA